MRKIRKIEPVMPVLPTRKRVAAYARVSMETERLHHSLSAQISYYSDLIQRNPEWEYVGVYADDGITGTQASKREEFQRMLEDCEAGKIDIVLTKSISRFARNTVDLLNAVRRLKELGVSVRFEKENIDSLSADGEVMLTLLASFAQEEVRSLSENERNHFLKVCEVEPRFILFQLMLFCGCRPSEAREIRGYDIQTMDGINVLHIRGTKTVNSDRYVPIPDALFDKIKETPKFSTIATTKSGKQLTKTDYRRLTSRLYREMNLSMGCKVYRNQLLPPYPLDQNFVPYFFRHTYCTDLALKGVDIRVAQKLMGHSDIKMTANIYTHVQKEHITMAAELLGATRGATTDSKTC